MAIITNGTTISRVVHNGTRMEKVFINGTQVFEEMSGNVTLVSGGVTTFSPGAEDVNRHFVIISGLFSSDGLPTGPVPTINGSSGTTIYNSTFNANGDGARIGIFTFKIPTGTGTFTVANADGRFAVYRVVGIPDMTSAYSTAFTPSGSVSIAAPPSGCGFIIAIQNFGSHGAVSGTDGDLVYTPGNPSFGANRALSGGTHVFGGSTQMNVAATFTYSV